MILSQLPRLARLLTGASKTRNPRALALINARAYLEKASNKAYHRRANNPEAIKQTSVSDRDILHELVKAQHGSTSCFVSNGVTNALTQVYIPSSSAFSNQSSTQIPSVLITLSVVSLDRSKSATKLMSSFTTAPATLPTPILNSTAESGVVDQWCYIRNHRIASFELFSHEPKLY